MSKDWRPYALHILECIAKLRRITERGDIALDDILYDAALRNLQTLAEATQRLPDDMKAAVPGIEWKAISGFRNILVHNYLGEIDPATVLTILERDISPLENVIANMLSKSA